MRGWATFGLALLLSGCIVPAGRAPAPTSDAPSGVVTTLHVPIHRLESAAGETTFASDPQGRAMYVGGSQWVYVSRDDGSTWTRAPGTALLGPLDGFSVAVDADGGLYAVTTEGANVDLSRSTDQARSWERTNFVAGLSAGIADRPWIAARGSGELAMLVGASHVTSAQGNYESCTMSDDRGQTWSLPDTKGSPGPVGGLAFGDDGTFYSVAQDGTVEKFVQRCSTSPQGLRVLDDDIVPDELPVATSGTHVFTAAPLKEGGLEFGGLAMDGGIRRIRVTPENVLVGAYPAIAARGDDVAALWYGSNSAGDFTAASWMGSFDVYVAIIHDFWGTASQRVYKIDQAAVHDGPICREGVSCGSASRGPGDYFAIGFDAKGGLNLAYTRDTGDVGIFHVRLTAGPDGRLHG